MPCYGVCDHVVEPEALFDRCMGEAPSPSSYVKPGAHAKPGELWEGQARKVPQVHRQDASTQWDQDEMNGVVGDESFAVTHGRALCSCHPRGLAQPVPSGTPKVSPPHGGVCVCVVSAGSSKRLGTPT